jgi:hypothetical protein
MTDNRYVIKLLGAWAAIQRRGSILEWIIILSVYGADTIAIDLSLSALISWFMKSIIEFFTILIYMQQFLHYK